MHLVRLHLLFGTRRGIRQGPLQGAGVHAGLLVGLELERLDRAAVFVSRAVGAGVEDDARQPAREVVRPALESCHGPPGRKQGLLDAVGGGTAVVHPTGRESQHALVIMRRKPIEGSAVAAAGGGQQSVQVARSEVRVARPCSEAGGRRQAPQVRPGQQAPERQERAAPALARSGQPCARRRPGGSEGVCGGGRSFVVAPGAVPGHHDSRAPMVRPAVIRKLGNQHSRGAVAASDDRPPTRRLLADEVRRRGHWPHSSVRSTESPWPHRGHHTTHSSGSNSRGSSSSVRSHTWTTRRPSLSISSCHCQCRGHTSACLALTGTACPFGPPGVRRARAGQRDRAGWGSRRAGPGPAGNRPAPRISLSGRNVRRGGGALRDAADESPAPARAGAG